MRKRMSRISAASFTGSRGRVRIRCSMASQSATRSGSPQITRARGKAMCSPVQASALWYFSKGCNPLAVESRHGPRKDLAERDIGDVAQPGARFFAVGSSTQQPNTDLELPVLGPAPHDVQRFLEAVRLLQLDC